MDMSMDLNALLSQLQSTQQARSSAKLSERNVVELINKLKQLGILGETELLHTINGKEYLTQECLKGQIASQLKQAGGRIALVELPALLGVDLVHCERQVAAIVAESSGEVQELQGELITTQYFDAIAAEINEQLHESGQLNVGELAAQYGLATEMIVNVITARLGVPGGVDGRLEGGLLYTPSFLRNIKAQLRGALRASTGPLLLGGLLRDLGLDVGSLGGAGGVVGGLVEELLQEGAVRGVLKGGGTNWMPAIYAEVQQDAVANFFNTNGWIAYDTVKRLGISNERQYLKSTFPAGIALDSAFVSPAVASSLEAAVEDALAAGSWADVGPLLPPSLGGADAAALLGRVAVLRDQERKPAKERRAFMVGSTWVVSAAFLAQLQERVDVDARARAHRALQERKAGGSAGAASASGQVQGGAASGGGGAAAGGGKGRKGAAAAAAAGGDSDEEDWSMGAGKKGGAKKKGGGKGGAAAGKGGGKGGDGGGGKGGAAAASPPGLSAGAIASQLREWYGDVDWGEEGCSKGDEDKAMAVAAMLLPGAVTAYEQALQAAFTAGAEERRRAKDGLAKGFEEAYARLLLYGAGADAFADDEAVHTTLLRHTLRTAGAECVDLLHKWAALEHVQDAQPPQPPAAPGQQAPPMSSLDRTQLAHQVPPDVAAGLASASDALNAASVRDAEALLDRAAGDVGVRARKLDKKGEKAALAALRDRLLNALSAEQDPPAALTLMVQLAFLKAQGKAVTLPGKALAAVLGRLQQAAAADQLPADLAAAVAGLGALYEGVVEYLKAQSGAGGADTGALLERLTEQLPALKAQLGLEQAHTEQPAAADAS